MGFFFGLLIAGSVVLFLHSRGGEAVLRQLLPARGQERWHAAGFWLMALGAAGLVISAVMRMVS